MLYHGEDLIWFGDHSISLAIFPSVKLDQSLGQVFCGAVQLCFFNHLGYQTTRSPPRRNQNWIKVGAQTGRERSFCLYFWQRSRKDVIGLSREVYSQLRPYIDGYRRLGFIQDSVNNAAQVPRSSSFLLNISFRTKASKTTTRGLKCIIGHLKLH